MPVQKFHLNFSQANKEMAELIILEITIQCFNEETNLFISNEQTYDLSTIDDELMFGVVDTVVKEIEKILDYIKCFVDGTSKAVNDTDLASVWKAAKKDVDAILNRIKACRNTENKIDEIR